MYDHEVEDNMLVEPETLNAPSEEEQHKMLYISAFKL